ncbi:MAG: DUF1553 domain-containing protein, partial [Planctomycetota bacterium]|nr:DUF1553 domain-containing protein [Planctomycetota bacterium]
MLSITAVAAEPDFSVDRLLEAENRARGVSLKPAPVVDDLAYLRRVFVDLIGRIPHQSEIDAYLSWDDDQRRLRIVDALMSHDRFTDRWTMFFSDLLRLRSNADGGGAAIAYIHGAIEDNVPYDQLARQLISATGKVGMTPELGFILGDNADPMALASATSQVFLGVRVSCAQCHDHPFDVWTRKDFYELAAFFGKTRRIETQFTKTVYTTEVEQSSVLWPPEQADQSEPRRPITPRFPFVGRMAASESGYLARFRDMRQRKQKALAARQVAKPDTSIDDLLLSAADKADRQTRGGGNSRLDVDTAAAEDARQLNIKAQFYRESQLRVGLARQITDPGNRYFGECFVNRVWAHLIGRGFVEPIDDFSEANPPSHPQTLARIAEEFVATDYQLKTLVRWIVTSQAYQRGHAFDADEATQAEMRLACLATPVRRMMAETMFDSIVTAGHLFDVKHQAGTNLKVVWRQSRLMKPNTKQTGISAQPLQAATEQPAKSMPARDRRSESESSYNLESAIEIDFSSVLQQARATKSTVKIDRMRVMSKEELEAERMQARVERPNAEYIDRFIKTTIDDNPRFGSAYRMASPSNPEHFLRVFGQTDRTQLGIHRDHAPSMRQALMLLNGRLTHEASRVGIKEAMYPLLQGDTADRPQAIRMAYREILTRLPTDEELQDAGTMLGAATTAL